jgi:hypothetical protein
MDAKCILYVVSDTDAKHVTIMISVSSAMQKVYIRTS